MRLILLVFCIAVLHSSAEAGEPLPVWLIHVPESTPAVFVADVSTYFMYRYEHGATGLQLSGSYPMSIGRNGWGKQRSGDRLTPVGAYLVTEQLDTSRLHEKYGATAFPLDYPNEWDRRLQRSGDGIWVHGVDRRGGQRRPPRDTDGCIALPNEDLVMLAESFVPATTPVVIAAGISEVDDSRRAQLERELRQAVQAWASSIEDGDLHAYLSSYSSDFEHWSMDKQTWAAFRLQTLRDRNISSVEISDLLLLGYPGEEGLFFSRFRQHLTEDGVDKVSTKRLYWHRDEHGVLTIIAEGSG